jgi:hypothetical protein
LRVRGFNSDGSIGSAGGDRPNDEVEVREAARLQVECAGEIGGVAELRERGFVERAPNAWNSCTRRAGTEIATSLAQTRACAFSSASRRAASAAAWI